MCGARLGKCVLEGGGGQFSLVGSKVGWVVGDGDGDQAKYSLPAGL
jgi:hypothetical protein